MIKNKSLKAGLLFMLAAMVAGTLFCACAGSPAGNQKDSTDITSGTGETQSGDITTKVNSDSMVKIHSFHELNGIPGETDDHAGETDASSLALDYRSVVSLRPGELGTGTAYYPRMKRLADNSYIMFYNTARATNDICYILSGDGINWSEPEYLAKSEVLPGGDRTLYANADACVLSDGDILVAYSFRTEQTYTTDLSKSGIAIRRSSDNGRTWSEPQTIYVGMNWEPFLLEDADKTIYCVFTHTAPYVYYYGYNTTIRSSGSAVVRSTDGGKTFVPSVTGAPYEAQRIMQSYIGMLDGRKIFNDQMPVMLRLNSGRLMLACESLQLNKTYYISLGYSEDGWAKALAIDEPGPEIRSTNMTRGAGPYLCQFPSGETLLSYANNNFCVSVGNADGERFSAATAPFSAFSNTALWGSMERADAHSVYCVFEDMRSAGTAKLNFLTYGRLCLNHRVNAEKISGTVADDMEVWEQNGDALFIGSLSQAQTALRFAYDEETVCILAERLDRYPDGSGDALSIYVSGEGKKDFFKLKLTAAGLTKLQYFDGKEYRTSDIKVQCTITSVSPEDAANPDDAGYTALIKINRADAGLSGDGFMLNAVQENTDNGKKTENDTFGGATLADTDTWQHVVLERINK